MPQGLLICLLTALLLGMSASRAASPEPAPTVTPAPPELTADNPQDYESLIAELEQQSGDFNRQLIEPLMGLARQQLAQGDLEAAGASIDRAQHLYHRNEGVMTLNQLSTVDLRIELLILQQEIKEADRQQHFAYHLAQNDNASADGAFTPQQQAALRRMAEWYKETGQYVRARRLLQDAVDAQQASPSSDPELLIDNLTRLATVTRLNRNCCSYDHLERAVAVAEAMPDASPQLKSSLYAQLADAYLIANKHDAARTNYQRAWQITEADQRAAFDAPQVLVQAQALESNFLPTETWVRRSRRSLTQASLNVDTSPNFDTFRRVKPRERFYIDSLPPQGFALPENTRNYTTALQDSNEPGVSTSILQVIGAPYQFNYKQLIQVLPSRFNRAEELDKLVVLMEFSVDEKGSPYDITVSTEDTPIRLERTLRKAVSRSTFRPRLVDGQPAPTEKMQLTQTFHTNG